MWPIASYSLAVLGLVGGMLLASHLLGTRHRERATGTPYESGIPTSGTSRGRLSVRFYLVAVFFVLFDLEVIFVLAWAVAARELGWLGFVEITIFIALLLLALAYIWRAGALDWSDSARDAKERTRAGSEGTSTPGAPAAGAERALLGRSP